MHLDLLAVLGQGRETALPENLNLLVGLILGLKFQRFPFRRPIAIIEERDRVTSDTSTEVLIPDFPECLFERWHKVFHFSLDPNNMDCPKYNLSSVLIPFHRE